MAGSGTQTWDRTEGWPFWAPSDLTTVEAALDLAGLQPGERFVDLGCGDGQVLVAAGRRGAEVLGIEIDEDLAASARDALAQNDLAGEVLVADLLALDLEADVVFTYLAPGTLQRLLPALRRLRGARLVTVDFEVPGLVADEVAGQAHLYRLPGRRARPRRPGWPAHGSLVAALAGTASLTCLELHHPGGPVSLAASPRLREAGTFRTGTDRAERGRPVAIDVRWEPHDAGTVMSGTLRVSGLPPHPLTVVFTDDVSEEALWELSDEGAAGIARALRRRRGPRPSTLTELLAAAESPGT